MKKYKVAILGATGAVGREMMKILAERDFPLEELHVLASERSVGKKLPFKGEELTVELACDEAFRGMDIVLGAAGNPIAKQFAPAIVAAGAVFVDNSSAFRMDPSVPLIVPEINPEDAKKHQGIISNPNCSTIITVTDKISILAAVGRKMAYRTGVSGKIFAKLGENGINVRMITQGPEELNIIVGVDNKDFTNAIRVLYNSFV